MYRIVTDTGSDITPPVDDYDEALYLAHLLGASFPALAVVECPDDDMRFYHDTHTWEVPAPHNVPEGFWWERTS